MYAVQHGHVDVMRTLVQLGSAQVEGSWVRLVDVMVSLSLHKANVVTFCKQASFTPLSLAIKRGQAKVVEYLLRTFPTAMRPGEREFRRAAKFPEVLAVLRSAVSPGEASDSTETAA